MKRIFINISLLAGISIVIGSNLNKNETKVELSELTLANIEALAHDESGKVDCLTESGSGCWNGYRYFPFYTENIDWSS